MELGTYNPRINKGLKVEYGNKIYDKIIYLSISNNEIHFENKENDSISNNISCKLNEAKISLE
jgi:hypothetical protein|nr:MAG TPA: hypothetical protein [Caudoviricetes sp.]